MKPPSERALYALPLLFALASAGCSPIPANSDAFVTARRGATGTPVLNHRWHVSVADRSGDANPQEFAEVAVFGERLYVGSARGALEARSTRDGALIWKREVGGINAAPTLDERGRLFVGTGDGVLLCLNAEDGEELWRYESQGTILHAPVLVDGQVIFSNEADLVFALDAEDGKFRWQYKSDTPEEFTLQGHSAVVADGDMLFTGFSNGNLVALRQSTGSVAWLTSLKGKASRFVDVDSTAVVSGDTVYVSSSAGGVYALDKGTGLVRWQYPIEGAIGVAVDGPRIFVTAADTGVHALDLSGNLLWRQGTRDGGDPAAPVVSGDYLLYTLGDAGMYVADKRSGEVFQYFQPGNGVSSTPLVLGNDLYVLSNRAVLYAMFLSRD
ncbi:PQQ-binding-like beta-propeller repeat protein [Haliangium ochraceum]|uniref:Pyrrolo-quinoline quinone n=1 Tax=Haliangium ochraceum (strain DSM 14365 / JCM 11303 / SMP-2) TaxID=502025 RepID=D0LY80_HALO1|nr:PQQ-binding-like beta-propeller repeat protein [Haliangium ochraceum]ACY16230.1 Pyrrolo-quinoline quinone [Haliangium ochraceum DSM 14365]